MKNIFLAVNEEDFDDIIQTYKPDPHQEIANIINCKDKTHAS